ncbi:hypothetical protein JTB14_030957 [Gonioctena quinquepunctata]|nr:hypothetical protein JTB14_017089 [Gonioctena quinquepunctata]KAG5872963.1 hypothetical protein JTB14_034273 [Gonioctena quinquepunctata]KAG5873602.1 hypothetical protein JTB14_013108 [Gonioctena quinquepunctata]KAG5890314.1 hypothetical protein JTB14_032824 [Gonioctena quinquepunctata]KAG5894935.1 hypothetical protein JTB14_030957 [Gonioctena quinquepunctata]
MSEPTLERILEEIQRNRIYTPEELFEIQATEAEEDSTTGKRGGSVKSTPTYLDKVQNTEHHTPAQQSLVIKENKQVITPKPTYVETKIGKQVENYPRKLRSVSSLLKQDRTK